MTSARAINRSVQFSASGAGSRGALVNVSEAAERLGTPVRFVRRLVAERRIRFYKVGRYIRLDVADLDEFVSAGLVEASVDAHPICGYAGRLPV
jgi:excisionase family DNA binding protein